MKLLITMLSFWLKIMAVLALFSPIAISQTYYVDPSGNDGNTGTSQGSGGAWRTVYKVNTTSFSAGSTILFKRGSTWNERLEPPSSGTSGSRITFGAYGTGAKPVFNSTEIVSGVSWTSNGDLTWSTTGFDHDPCRLILGGVNYGDADNTGNLGSRYRWQYVSGTLTVYTGSNSNNPYAVYGSSGVVSTKGSIGGALSISGKNYITLSNLDFRGDGPCENINGSDYITMDSCNLNMWANGSLLIQGQSDYFTATYCTFNSGDTVRYTWRHNDNGGGDAILIYGGDHGLIDHCTFSGWRHGGINSYHSGSQTNNDWEVRYSDFSCKNDYARALDWHAYAYGQEDGWLVHHNYFHNITGTAIFEIGTSLAKIYYNVFDTIGVESWYGEETGEMGLVYGACAIDLRDHSGRLTRRNEIYNNLIMNCQGVGLKTQANSYVDSNYIYNNIFINNGLHSGYSHDCELYIDENKNGAGNFYRNNLIYNSSTTSTIQYQWALNNPSYRRTVAWVQENPTTEDVWTGNLFGDPQLTSAYKIPNGSPAQDAGTNSLMSTPDYFGGTVPYNTTVDIGVHEYTTGGGGQPDSAATVTTNAASGETQSSAVLNGTVNPHGTQTTVAFQIGTQTGVYTQTVSASPSPITTTGNTSVSATKTGLGAGTTYFYRVVGVNIVGTTNGSEQSFAALAGDTSAPVLGSTATSGIYTAKDTISATVPVSSASNRFVTAAVIGYNDGGLPATSSVTCAGNAMTLAGSAVSPSGRIAVRVYQYTAPAVGTNKISVTLASAASELGLMVSTWSSVRQTASLGTVATQSGVGTGGSTTLDVIADTGDVVVDFSASYGMSFVAGQEEVVRIDGASDLTDGLHTQAPGLALVSMSQDFSTGLGYARVAFALKATSGTLPEPPSTSKNNMIIIFTR
jgi:hypothetical protein